MSYYGYKPADQDKAVIDWAGLTKTISDDLLAEKKRRDDTKAFLNQETAEQLQKINEYEQGLDPQANTWMMEQIQSARAFMLENQRLMKRGLRPVNDKRLVDQNVMNTYTDLNNALKTYNSKIEELSKLPGKSNEALIDEMANFAQLRNRKIYNDPNTGAGYLADVDPATGEIDQKRLMPVRAINSMQQQSFETVNVTDEVNKAVEKMGTWKVAISSTEDINNVRLNPKYQQTIEDLTSSILSSDQRKASVLLDYLDLDYSKDGDDAAQGSIEYDYITGYDKQGRPEIETRSVNIGKVLMENGPDGKLRHKLTPQQEELAREAIKSNIESKLLFETSKQFVKDTSSDRSDRATRQNKIDTYSTVEKFFQGDAQAGQALASQFGMDAVPVIQGDKMIYSINGVEYTSDASGAVKDAASTFVGGLANATGGKYGMSVEDYNRWSTNTSIVPADFNITATSISPLSKTENYVTPGNVKAIQQALETTTMLNGVPVPIELPADLSRRVASGELNEDSAMRLMLKDKAMKVLQQLGAGKFEVSPFGGDAIKVERNGNIEYVTAGQLQDDPEAVLERMQSLVRSKGGASRFNK